MPQHSFEWDEEKILPISRSMAFPLEKPNLHSSIRTVLLHAYQESAHKFEKSDFMTVSKPNIRFLSSCK